MAIRVFDVSETCEYSLKEDTVDPTVFVIGRIDHKLWAHLQDKNARMEVSGLGAEAEGSVKFDVNARNSDFVRFGLKGWRNLKDKNGNEVEFSTVSCQTGVGNRPGLSDRYLDMFRPFLAELAGQIEQFNAVSGEATKN